MPKTGKTSGTHMGLRSPQNEYLVNKSTTIPKHNPAGTNTIADSMPKSAPIQSPNTSSIKKGG